jgi:ethanolamine utilization protein EutN
MFLARVENKIISTQKHKAYKGRTMFLVQPILPNGTAEGNEWAAVDYVGAGIGDVVICGGAPGVAKTVFNLELAPIRTLIMGIVDKINYQDI